MVGVHRLAHAMSAVAIATWGKKIKSRKIPLITLGSILAITIFINVGVNQNVSTEHNWSVYLMMIASGMFVATTGMQNVLWVENYSFKNIFASMALMTLLPALADCFNKVFLTYPTINYFEFERWLLLASAILVVIAIVYFVVFIKEDKAKIRAANNDFDDDVKVSSFDLKRVLINSVGIFLAATSFEMIRSTGVNKFFLITAFHSDDSTMTTLLVSSITSLVAIFTSLALIKRFKSYKITIVAEVISLASMVFGLIIVSTGALNIATWVCFMVASSFGLSMYLAVTFGVMLHFHLHSKILVLPIWLSIRIFGMFLGQIISNEWMILADDKEFALQMVFVVALVLSSLSFAWTIYRYIRNEYVLYNLVDRYEFSKIGKKSFNFIKK